MLSDSHSREIKMKSFVFLNCKVAEGNSRLLINKHYSNLRVVRERQLVPREIAVAS